MNKEQKIVLGRFASPYGIRGWSKIISYTTPPENLLRYTTWQIKRHHQWETHQVQNARPHGKFFVAKMVGCDSPEHARQFTNAEIAINRSELPPLAQNEFYWSDLIGFRVVNTDGIELGHVDAFINTGANDVIVLKSTERERLIPYIKSVVISVDLIKKVITVDWDPDF